jgi:predicted GNAT superfamily acetyltransferase
MQMVTETAAGDTAHVAGERVSIRLIETIEDYRRCEELQTTVWGPDDIVGIPLLSLITAQDNGGIVLGAFAPGGALVGFVYSFPGLVPTGGLKQCSVILAVHPDYQNRNVGLRLKLAQRDAALAQGIDLITWTFDPLVSTNAYLNLAKLGGASSTYLTNLYGLGQGLNAGLETDRLLVEWWLSETGRPGADRAESPERARTVVNVLESHPRSGVPINRGYDLTRADEWLGIRIPRDIGAVKEADVELAQAWRAQTREMFTTYLGRGYRVRSFDRDAHEPDAQPCYLLHREPDGPRRDVAGRHG